MERRFQWIEDWTERRGEEFRRIGKEIWNYAETGMEEINSASLLCQALQILQRRRILHGKLCPAVVEDHLLRQLVKLGDCKNKPFHKHMPQLVVSFSHPVGRDGHDRISIHARLLPAAADVLDSRSVSAAAVSDLDNHSVLPFAELLLCHGSSRALRHLCHIAHGCLIVHKDRDLPCAG